MDDTTRGPAPGDGGLKDLLKDCTDLLSSVRHTLSDLLREVRGDNPEALRELAEKQSQLETALTRVFAAELKYNDWKAKQDGTRPDHEFDLAAARFDIGCRLARLRECCAEGLVSERADAGGTAGVAVFIRHMGASTPTATKG